MSMRLASTPATDIASAGFAFAGSTNTGTLTLVSMRTWPAAAGVRSGNSLSSMRYASSADTLGESDPTRTRAMPSFGRRTISGCTINASVSARSQVPSAFWRQRLTCTSKVTSRASWLVRPTVSTGLDASRWIRVMPMLNCAADARPAMQNVRASAAKEAARVRVRKPNMGVRPEARRRRRAGESEGDGDADGVGVVAGLDVLGLRHGAVDVQDLRAGRGSRGEFDVVRGVAAPHQGAGAVAVQGIAQDRAGAVVHLAGRGRADRTGRLVRAFLHLHCGVRVLGALDADRGRGVQVGGRERIVGAEVQRVARDRA